MSTDQQPQEPAERFRAWAKAASCTAMNHRASRDAYAERLSLARSAVYEDAADLVEERGVEDAVPEMLARAGRLRVLTPPIVNFDAAGLRYIQARAWQFCAQTLDPQAPVVQPPWD